MVPLGPFHAKNFATTVSPWIVTMDALAPYRLPWTRPRRRSAAAGLPRRRRAPRGRRARHHARGADRNRSDAQPAASRAHRCRAPTSGITTGRSRRWSRTTPRAAATSDRATCSAAEPSRAPSTREAGALIELALAGQEPVQLPGGEQRSFLQDGDAVVLRGWCAGPGRARIGFGAARGLVLPAPPTPSMEIVMNLLLPSRILAPGGRPRRGGLAACHPRRFAQAASGKAARAEGRLSARRPGRRRRTQDPGAAAGRLGGQTVIVDNAPGASGSIGATSGAERAARRPDAARDDRQRPDPGAAGDRPDPLQARELPAADAAVPGRLRARHDDAAQLRQAWTTWSSRAASGATSRCPSAAGATARPRTWSPPTSAQRRACRCSTCPTRARLRSSRRC